MSLLPASAHAQQAAAASGASRSGIPAIRWTAAGSAEVIMLPFTLSGTIVVAHSVGINDPMEAVMQSMVSGLEREKPAKLSRSGSRIEFKGGLFRAVPSWNKLVAIERGELTVEHEQGHVRIRYKIWFTQLLIVVTLQVGVGFGVPMMLMTNTSLSAKLAILLFLWLWLAGGNIVSTAGRFPRLLRGMAEDAVRRGP